MLSKKTKKKFLLTLLGSSLVFAFFFLNFNFYLSNFLISNFSYKSDYLSINSSLKEKISILEARIKLQDALINENLSLKKTLNYNLPKSLSLINAELVIVSPFTFTSSGVINKGSLHGVRKGFLAISPKGLVGKVSDVNKESSEILFTFNPNLGQNKIPGLLKGNGMSSRIKYITRDEKIVEGDDVFIATNSIEEYPGIKIGEISRVVDYEGFLDLSIKDLIDPRNAKFLTVIIND